MMMRDGWVNGDERMMLIAIFPRAHTEQWLELLRFSVPCTQKVEVSVFEFVQCHLYPSKMAAGGDLQVCR